MSAVDWRPGPRLRAALIAELPNLLAIAQEQRAEIARLTALCERLEEEW